MATESLGQVGVAARTGTAGLGDPEDEQGMGGGGRGGKLCSGLGISHSVLFFSVPPLSSHTSLLLQGACEDRGNPPVL